MAPAAQHRNPDADTIMHVQHQEPGMTSSKGLNTYFVTSTVASTLELRKRPTQPSQHKISETIQAQATASSGSSTSTRFKTGIRTLISTLPPTSTFDRPIVTPVLSSGRFPIPQIQGLIPGLRRALHPNSDLRSLSPTPSHDQALKERILRSTVATPSIPILTHCEVISSPSPRRSRFPRVSPPGFLYPENLVPKSVYPLQHEILMQQPGGMHHNESPYQPGVMGRVDYELAYLPTGVKLLFVGTLAVIVLAVIWIVLVCLINFPPKTWGFWHLGARGGGGSGGGWGGKRKKEERRPLDKPSKHAPGEMEGKTGATEGEGATTSALPFSQLNDNVGEDQGIEMRQRPCHHIRSHQRQQTQLVRPQQTSTDRRRTSSSPALGLRFSHTPTPTISAPPSPTTSNLSSPPNPFLDPPGNGFLAPGTAGGLVKRSSTEWKRERAAFFSSPSPAHTPRSTSLVPSLHRSHHSSSPSFGNSYSLETSDIEALEAGEAPLTGHMRPSPTQSISSKDDGPNGVLHKSLSWFENGLELVDGAVDGFVAQLGRWTDDDGGEEALLLPVARGGKLRMAGV